MIRYTADIFYVTIPLVTYMYGVPSMTGAIEGTNIQIKNMEGSNQTGFTFPISGLSNNELLVLACGKVGHGLTDGYIKISANAAKIVFQAEV
jgi:hypothetical protein